MQKISILIIIVLVTTLSCKEEYQSNEYTIINEQNLKDKGNKLFELISEYELIPLQYVGDESLVSSIVKSEICSRGIYLLCTKPNGLKYLLIFDLEGNFNKRITEINSDELISSNVKYFALDEKENLLILDEKDNLIFLDENFNYLKHVTFPFKSDTFYKSGAQFLSYANHHAFDLQPDTLMFNLIVLNGNFDIKNKFMPFKISVGETRYHHRFHGNIQPNLNGFLFTEFLNDTVYEISEQTMVPKFVLNFGEARVDREEFNNLNIQPFSPILTEKFKWGINSPIETEQYLFVHYWDKSIPKGILFDKINQNATIHNPMNLLNDHDIIPWPKFNNNGYLYGYFTEGDFGGMDTEKIKKYPSSSSVKKIYEHIQSNANPVFVKYKLKTNKI